MSSSGTTVYKDFRTGQYYTLDRDGDRRPAATQAPPSRPRAINSTSQYPTASQLDSSAGTSPPTTQERRQAQVLSPKQPRTVTCRGPNVYPTELSSSYDSTARSDWVLASPISQTPSNQWTPNTSHSIRSVQPCSPNYLTAIPTSSVRSTNASLPSYGFAAGMQQSGKCQRCSNKCWQQLILTQRAPVSHQLAGQVTEQHRAQQVAMADKDLMAMVADSCLVGRTLIPVRSTLLFQTFYMLTTTGYKLRSKRFFTRGRVSHILQ
jgi:hypothetical protein